MQIYFQKLEKSQDQITATRNDGVTVKIPQAGRKFSLPHDFAHLIVESELNMKEGFWGSISAGALIKGITVVSGRQKPHAGKRNLEIIKRNQASLNESEVAVSRIYDIAMNRLNRFAYSRVLKELTTNYPHNRYEFIKVDDIKHIVLLLVSFTERWQSMDYGQTLQIEWNERAPKKNFQQID
jgi:hypothetical protein